jgi:mRNA-degrading endonuclease toxin of MazEF toxin-antitoxin module
MINMVVQMMVLVLNNRLIDDSGGVMVVAMVTRANYAQRISSWVSVVGAIGRCNGRKAVLNV